MRYAPPKKRILNLVKRANDNANLRLTVLFEDGDNIEQVIADTRSKLLVEAFAMKDTEFLDEIEQ